MSSGRNAAQNALLAALPRQDHKRMLGYLKPASLSFGDILHEPGKPIARVYFPVTALISLLTVVDDKPLEVGMIGREGVLGIPLAFGVKHSPVRALVQGAGLALAMPTPVFLREFKRSPPLQGKVLGFANELMHQIGLSAACNRFHPVTARLARWLLMTRDRVGSDEFRLTHKFLADMLGVRRAGVTIAASSLQRSKVIDYSRGRMRILNERKLEASACSCYEVGRSIYR
jgi:CRP-like cAMP-binding protein